MNRKPRKSSIEKIKQAKELLNIGVISQEEYNKIIDKDLKEL